MKTIALQMPDSVAALRTVRLDSSLKRLVTRLRETLARAEDGAMQVSDTERLTHDAHTLRAALLRGSR